MFVSHHLVRSTQLLAFLEILDLSLMCLKESILNQNVFISWLDKSSGFSIQTLIKLAWCNCHWYQFTVNTIDFAVEQSFQMSHILRFDKRRNCLNIYWWRSCQIGLNLTSIFVIGEFRTWFTFWHIIPIEIGENFYGHTHRFLSWSWRIWSET